MTTKSKQLANAIREYGIAHQKAKKERGEAVLPAVKYNIDYLSEYLSVNKNTLYNWIKPKSDGVPEYMHEHIEVKLGDKL